MGIGDWGLGIGDWGLGIGDWAQSPIPNPQSPIPNDWDAFSAEDDDEDTSNLDTTQIEDLKQFNSHNVIRPIEHNTRIEESFSSTKSVAEYLTYGTKEIK